MPVTTSTGVKAPDKSTNPVLAALLLDNLTISFVPAGIMSLMDATIFMLSRFVVMLYFVLLSLTDVRLEPGTASLMMSGSGFPATEILVIGFTSIVTIWVTLLVSACAQTVPVDITTRRTNVAKNPSIERLDEKQPNALFVVDDSTTIFEVFVSLFVGFMFV
jgi:hypothetical protein